MQQSRENSKIAQESHIARERGETAVRKFDRVVSSFKNVLAYKEQMRVSHEEKVANLKSQLQENTERLETLARNIETYSENLTKIALNVEHLENEEHRVKQKYELLLQGSKDSSMILDAKFQMGDVDKPSRDQLIQRRKDYLESLSGHFKELDDELLNIDGLMQKLLNARTDISRKREDALRNKAALDQNGQRLLGEIAQGETNREKAQQEEKILVQEFAKLVINVEGCLNLSEEIESVLLSYMKSSEQSSSLSMLNGSHNGGLLRSSV